MFIAGAGAVGRVGRPGLSGNGARRPSFDVDFVSSGSIGVDAVFTRASTGTYYDSAGVLRSAAINTPRFDYDPTTLQLKGLLLEDASTNSWLQSADANNAAWGKGNLIVGPPATTANQIVAPDGTLTAASVVLPAVIGAGAVSQLIQSITTAAQTYVFSMYMRGAVGGEQLYLYTKNASNYTRQRFTLTTQWQRFSYSMPLSALAYQFSIGTDLRDTNQTSTPAQTIYAWGAQVEALPYMSSYIPTTSVSVTRARDALNYPIASVTGFNTTAGSFLCEIIYEGLPTANIGRGLELSDGTTTNVLGWYPDNANSKYQVISVIAGVTGTALFPDAVPVANTINKVAVSWGANRSASANGSAVVRTPGGIGTTTRADFANRADQTRPLSVWYRRFSVWPRTLSDSEIQAVTTLAGPTLSLDFMSDGILDPRITFTRASSATYTDASGVIQTAATNAPRWDYANGVLRGLLIEEARTNIALNSANFTVAPWARVGVGGPTAPTVTGNAAVAPDGTTTATRVNYPAVSGGVSSINNNLTVTTSVYTLSVWARGVVGGEKIWLSTTIDAVSYARTPMVLTTAWQRFTVTPPAFTGTTWTMLMGVDMRDNGIQTAQPAQSVYLWGGQVELGAFVTSYIPTTSVAVTRAADAASLISVPLFGGSGGKSLFIDGYALQNTAPTTNTAWCSLNDGTTVNQMQFTNPANSGMFRSFIAVGGTTYINGNDTTTGPRPGRFKAAISNDNTGSSAINGVLAASGIASAPLSVTDRLTFGTAPGLITQINGYLGVVQYWNRALSATEMQQVTT